MWASELSYSTSSFIIFLNKMDQIIKWFGFTFGYHCISLVSVFIQCRLCFLWAEL
jgi:hypothetical protein